MDSLSSFITGLVMTASVTSMTGGVEAHAGQTVTTGDSYSAVHVENSIQGTNSGGSSHTVVTTNVNGVEHTEVKDEPLATSSITRVYVATSSTAAGSMVHKHSEGVSSLASSTIAIEIKGVASSSVPTNTLVSRISGHVSNLFKNFLGWWGFMR